MGMVSVPCFSDFYLKKEEEGPGRWLRIQVFSSLLSKDLSPASRTHIEGLTTAYNSGSRALSNLFWSPLAPACMCAYCLTDTYMYTSKEKENLLHFQRKSNPG